MKSKKDTSPVRSRDKVLQSLYEIELSGSDVRDILKDLSLQSKYPHFKDLLNGVMSSKEAIDEIMKLGMSHPMGPLQLADFIGLDVCLDIMEVLWIGFNDSKYRPCTLLKTMVSSGLLGKKSGRGFYKYD